VDANQFIKNLKNSEILLSENLLLFDCIVNKKHVTESLSRLNQIIAICLELEKDLEDRLDKFKNGE